MCKALRFASRLVSLSEDQQQLSLFLNQCLNQCFNQCFMLTIITNVHGTDCMEYYGLLWNVKNRVK